MTIMLTIHDEDRAANFIKAFGKTTVPIQSTIPVMCDLPAPLGKTWCYLLDLNALTTEQRDKLAAVLAENFNLPLAAVRPAMEAFGVPIPAKDTTVVFRQSVLG